MCSRCKARHLPCGPKVFPAPDSESNRMKKWKQFLGKATPVLLEMFESAENPEDIVHSLKALSKRLDSSSEITPSSSSIFTSVQPPSPAYPQTMSDPVFPFTFANNSTKISMPQFTPHVPGAGYYTVSTTPYPLSAPASGTFSHPIVPAPSLDPSQSSFSSNATQQYQYPSPPIYNPSPQYQSMQYPNPSDYYNQSMSEAHTEFDFEIFDENVNF